MVNDLPMVEREVHFVLSTCNSAKSAVLDEIYCTLGILMIGEIIPEVMKCIL